jgi:hypothetical protein
MNDLAAEILKNTGGDTRASSASSSFSVASADGISAEIFQPVNKRPIKRKKKLPQALY